MPTHFTKLKGKYYVATSAPSNPKDGERWFDSDNGVLYQYNASDAIWYGHQYTSTSSSTTTTTSTSTSTSTTSTSSSTSTTTTTSTSTSTTL